MANRPPVVAFTAYNRPGYMRDTLESWSKVRGIGDTTLFFRVDPSPVTDEMVAVCETAAEFAEKVQVIVNDDHYGALGNPWHAFTTGFSESNFVIVAEDDSVVGTDTLEYFRWCDQQFRKDPRVLSVCAFRADSPDDPQTDGVRVLPYFAPTIWGTWYDRWCDYLAPDWDFDYRYKGWDWRITEHWLGQRGFRNVVPDFARSQHIGREQGTHCTAEMFDSLLSRCYCPDLMEQNYREVQ